MIPLLLAQVEDRLRTRIDQAETAHVTEHTTRCTKNCRHARPLSNGSIGCTARRWGTTEQEALTCNDTKALACPGFSPPHTEEELRSQFRSMPEAELCLRWNSVNELLWARRQILNLLDSPDPAPTPTDSSTPTPTPAPQLATAT
jgi:hypothetical protein